MISTTTELPEERVSVIPVPEGKEMTRHEFARYLESHAEMLGIQLDRQGSTVGLPSRFHHAIAVAQFLHALGQPAPHPDDVREWYGIVEFGTGEVGRHIHWLLGTLRAWDFEELSYPDLLFAMTRASNLEGLLRVLLLRARSKRIAADGREARTSPRAPDAESLLSAPFSRIVGGSQEFEPDSSPGTPAGL